MARRWLVAILAVLAVGCAGPGPVTRQPEPLPPWPAMERADVYESVMPETRVVGHLQRVVAGQEDTFSDIARRFDLGYEELAAANPGVDPWVPGEGTVIVLPTAHVIPDAPREGIVINLPAMRLWWFGEPEVSGAQTVVTHPIGIGRVGWATPVARTRVVSRARDPVWYPPASVRREHAAEGDPLPTVVPAGPDNPLGRYALQLELPGYLIHGTNKPWGVGMRVSHGCIRLYPEDIETLFPDVATGTPVALVDQPWLVAEQDGRLVLEAHPPLEDGASDWTEGLSRLERAAGEQAVDWARAAEVVARARGIPIPVGPDAPELAAWVGRAPVVENRARGNYVEAAGPAPAAPAGDAAR